MKCHKCSDVFVSQGEAASSASACLLPRPDVVHRPALGGELDRIAVLSGVGALLYRRHGDILAVLLLDIWAAPGWSNEDG
jgi:hypothetical protein